MTEKRARDVHDGIGPAGRANRLRASHPRRGTPEARSANYWLRPQVFRPSALRFGLAALRPIAVSIRLIVENRLSASGPRIAFWMKAGPPCPTVVFSRLFASAIWVFSSCRLRTTSACASAGTATLTATFGQLTVGTPAAAFEPEPPAPAAAPVETAVGCAAEVPPPWLSVQVLRPSAFRSGLAALRPIAVSIRLIVANRLSASGPRIAFWMKLGPPCPTVVFSRLLASAIWVFSNWRLLWTSACACAGTATPTLTAGQLTVGTAASAEATPRPTPAMAIATPATAAICQRRALPRGLVNRDLEYIGTCASREGPKPDVKSGIAFGPGYGSAPTGGSSL